jgi:hypothetical protein
MNMQTVRANSAVTATQGGQNSLGSLERVGPVLAELLEEALDPAPRKMLASVRALDQTASSESDVFSRLAEYLQSPERYQVTERAGELYIEAR